MTVLIAVFASVLGAAVGSFGNVVVYRVPRGLSLLAPGSACPACGSAIRGFDNIPLLSFLLLRARCRACGDRISARYPIVEAGITAVWVVSALRFRELEVAGFVATSATVLVLVALIDLEHRRIPNVIVLPSTAASLVWVLGVSLAQRDPALALRAAACGAAFFSVLFVIALVSGGMGFGDVKLGAFIGVITGRFGVGVWAAGVLGAFIAGGMFAVALLVAGRRGRKDTLAFGPWMALGAAVALFVGDGPVRAWLGL